jgi:hypothetical protein
MFAKRLVLGIALGIALAGTGTIAGTTGTTATHPAAATHPVAAHPVALSLSGATTSDACSNGDDLPKPFCS